MRKHEKGGVGTEGLINQDILESNETYISFPENFFVFKKYFLNLLKQHH